MPGDIVLLEAGDIVPADLRVIKAHNFLADESVLTVESAPILKHSEKLLKEEKDIFKAKNILFAWTSVASGKAKATVVATGKDTFVGDIVKIVSGEDKKSAYEKNILYFCRLILRIVSVTIILVFLANIALKGLSDFMELLLFSVALIVSILPEALPAVVTFALSRGSLKMARENVVVKRLSAIEDLGNIEILCTDKTGTLTQNKLSLEKIVSQNKEKSMVYVLAGADEPGKSSNNVNYFDAAISQRSDYKIVQEIKKLKIVRELPFDSFRMRSSIVAQNKNGKKILITKGAPEVILKRCSTFLGNQKRNEIKEAIVREGQDGKRVIVVAYKNITKENISSQDEKVLTFLGYFVFEDALRSSAQEAVRLAKKLGVQVKIITGDAPEVAGFVAHKVGLATSPHDVILGQDLEKMHQEEFNNNCQDHAVFARVSPQIKYRIIKSLQKEYEVGFLGEGINDVPALKIANVGVVVSGATDIAREAADVVLLQKDLRVIINGIKDGRSIFSNINKYIRSTLVSNFGNFYSVAAISLFVPFLPMLPVQILLANLLTDFPLVSIVTDSVDTQELSKPKMYQLHM